MRRPTTHHMTINTANIHINHPNPWFYDGWSVRWRRQSGVVRMKKSKQTYFAITPFIITWTDVNWVERCQLVEVEVVCSFPHQIPQIVHEFEEPVKGDDSNVDDEEWNNKNIENIHFQFSFSLNTYVSAWNATSKPHRALCIVPLTTLSVSQSTPHYGAGDDYVLTILILLTLVIEILFPFDSTAETRRDVGVTHSHPMPLTKWRNLLTAGNLMIGDDDKHSSHIPL